jgi:hypothetical protein
MSDDARKYSTLFKVGVPCYIQLMNSDTEILVSEILDKSGALIKCSVCGKYMLLAYNQDAESMAYGMAEDAWKRDERGFRGMGREEISALIKRRLVEAFSRCPSCR